MPVAALTAADVLDALDQRRSEFSDGIETSSMDALATVAGVSRATLYRLFGSQQNLLEQLGLEPPQSVRGRVVQTALDLVGAGGAGGWAMDDLAGAAGVSRATLYRLFPGKAALLAELVRQHSPFEPIAGVLETMSGRPPAEVIPAIARAMATAMDGRMGLLLELLAEVSRGGSDSRTGSARDADLEAAPAMRTIPLLAAYLDDQMAAGQLRRMDPLVAFQALAGPIVMHLLSRPVLVTQSREDDDGRPTELLEVVDELAGVWLRGMTATPEGRI